MRFEDPAAAAAHAHAAVDRAALEGVLRAAQAQERVLRALEREMARGREYLGKVRCSVCVCVCRFVVSGR